MERKDDFTKTEEEMVSKLNKMADELIEKIKSNVAGKVCEKLYCIDVPLFTFVSIKFSATFTCLHFRGIQTVCAH